jgi:hypothetical protein
MMDNGNVVEQAVDIKLVHLLVGDENTLQSNI